jgi:septal ring factor EnvC (AmiA/AmiB activator)
VTTVLTGLIGLFGIVAGSVTQYLLARLRNSGTVRTSAPDVLWSASEQMREEQRDEIISQRADMGTLRAEIGALKSDLAGCRREMASLQRALIERSEELDRLREDNRRLRIDNAKLRKGAS